MAVDPLAKQPAVTEVVGVLRAHLEEIRVALDWSRGHFLALDLADRYRDGHPSPRPKRATVMVEKAYDHVAGYLMVEDDDNE
jgi:hypothetical protein